ncbi:pupal cuticle protein Edg-91 [Drosophila willistoni]|nr:pupal cuticle protein Edg-91 [Drosophila willistoni]
MESLMLPLPLLLMLLLVLPLGTHLTEAEAAVREGGWITAAVDKEVAPVGDVKTDLLSLEQEIGGSMESQLSTAGVVGEQNGKRRAARGLWFSGGLTGYPFGNWGSGYAWSYPGYGYYGGLPYNGNGNGYGLGYGYGGIGYYPSYLGYQKIILG